MTAAGQAARDPLAAPEPLVLGYTVAFLEAGAPDVLLPYSRLTDAATAAEDAEAWAERRKDSPAGTRYVPCEVRAIGGRR